MLEKVINTVDEYLNPEEKDFTVFKEDELIAICRKCALDDNPVTDFVGKILLYIPFAKVINKLYNWHTETVIQSYDYTAKTIRRIFSQARSCDADYARKLRDEEDVIDASQKLLKKLALQINPNNVAECGEHLDYYLHNFRAGMTEEVAVLESQVNKYDIIRTARESEDDEFTKCSESVFGKVFAGKAVNGKLWKIVKGREKNYLDVCEKLYNEKIEGEVIDKTVEDALKDMLEDDVLVKAAMVALGATGVDASVKNYLRLVALKQLENTMNQYYLDARNELRNLSVDDPGFDEAAERYQNTYSAMKDVEIKIQTTYADMHPNNANVQMDCNDRISQIDNRYVISHYEEEDGPLTPLG